MPIQNFMSNKSDSIPASNAHGLSYKKDKTAFFIAIFG